MPEPGAARDGGRPDRAGRGADPDALGRAGRADHHLVREDAADPRAGQELQAVRGFNVIATANDRDRGVNELSSALRRRFNTVVLPVPASAEQEVEIVTRRVAQLGRSIGLPETAQGAEEIRRVVRSSASCGRASPKTDGPRSSRRAARCPPPRRSPWSPAAWLWPPISATACCAPPTWPAGSPAPSIQDPASDRAVWQEYLETVVRERDDWSDFYRACRDAAG